MNILTNWKNFTDEELEQVKKSLEAEKQKRKEKTAIIKKFLNAFHELEKAGISVSYDIGFIPGFDEDIIELENSSDFLFSHKKG